MYVVLTKTLHGWTNCWTETLPDGTERPMEFRTKKEAQKEIDELVEEMTAFFNSTTGRDSQIPSSLMGYDPEDYKIVKNGPQGKT